MFLISVYKQHSQQQTHIHKTQYQYCDWWFSFQTTGNYQKTIKTNYMNGFRLYWKNKLSVSYNLAFRRVLCGLITPVVRSTAAIVQTERVLEAPGPKRFNQGPLGPISRTQFWTNWHPNPIDSLIWIHINCLVKSPRFQSILNNYFKAFSYNKDMAERGVVIELFDNARDWD